MPASLRLRRAVPWDNESPIRAELFSVERLENHAASLAASQPVSTHRARWPSLAARLVENERVLLDAYRDIARTVAAGGAITPAAEWLLDNFHVVDEQISEIRTDLPPGYYRKLPKLTDGPFVGYPRIFGMAWAYVAHTDSHFDPQTLLRFVLAYQRQDPLTIGELWAIAITLRIVLVENLRRCARRIVMGRIMRQAADALADHLLDPDFTAGDHLRLLLKEYERGPLHGAFAVQLVQRLRDQDVKAARVLAWLEERLARQGAATDQMVQAEHQEQAETNVTVRNIITSMRHIAEIDWAELFESVSLVDDALRSGSNFADLDFPTRNSYRASIEELARGSQLTELEIARAVLGACAGAAGSGDVPGACASDPGFHLIAGGRRAFEQSIGFRPPLTSLPRRFNEALGITGYAAIVLILAVFLLAVPLVLIDAGTGTAVLVTLAVLGLIPAIDAAVPLVNRAIAREIDSLALPGLALRDGVPSGLRTLVAMPTLLATVADAEEHARRLEVHYLASQEEELYFALLSDWVDADAETVDGDLEVFQAAAAEIDRLNRQYGPGPAGARFHLFHRRRAWNPSQRKWMGWERKRGKIHELNRLLRGTGPTSFVNVRGQAPAPPPGRALRHHPGCRHQDAAGDRTPADRKNGPSAQPPGPVSRRAAHHRRSRPAAAPCDAFAAGRSRSIATAAGILPRQRHRSLRVHRVGRLPGPVRRRVLHGQGDIRRRRVRGRSRDRVPENTLLSHDLFEGVFVRSGLVSDIEVVEEFPAHYDAAVARHHRWTRGDWQLLPWILGRADASGRTRGSVPAVGRFKMLDNLRRSLSAPANVAALIAGWMLPPHAAMTWTAFLLIMLAIPPGASCARGRPAETSRFQRAEPRAGVWQGSRAGNVRGGAAGCFPGAPGLAHGRCDRENALASGHRPEPAGMGDRGPGDAQRARRARRVLRIHVEQRRNRRCGARDLVVRRRHLADRASRCHRMAGCTGHCPGGEPVEAGDGTCAGVGRERAPAAARGETHLAVFRAIRHGRGQHAAAGQLSGNPHGSGRSSHVSHEYRPLPAVCRQRARLRLDRNRRHGGTARSDARDAGQDAALSWPFLQLVRHAGPAAARARYISSVDSGNLAGHLIALASACRERPAGPVAGDVALTGIGDALAVARDLLRELPRSRRTQTITSEMLGAALESLQQALAPGASAAEDMESRLRALVPLAATAVDMAGTLASERGDAAARELHAWVEAAQRAIDSHLRDYLPGSLSGIDLTARSLQSRAWRWRWSTPWTSASCSTTSASCSRSDTA
jgi:hypothetical protein